LFNIAVVRQLKQTAIHRKQYRLNFMFSKNTALNIFFSMTFLLLILNCVFLVQSIMSLMSAEDVVNHTFEVRLTVDGVLSLIKDAETGQRGFIITGEEKYLEPYNAALPQIDTSINQLQLLTKDNKIQQERVILLREKVQRRIDRIEQTIDLRRNKGFIEAQKNVLTGIGKMEMDDVRSNVAEIKTEELNLFDQRLSENNSRRLTTWITIAVTSLVSFGLIVFLFFYIKRDLSSRVKLAENLRVSQELTQATINSLEAHIAAIDEKGNIIVINKAWETFVKENSDDLCQVHEATIGLSYKEIYQIGKKHSEDELKTAIQGIGEVLNGEKDQLTFEYHCETKSGEHWFLVNVTPMRLKKSGVVISQTDITSMKNVEKEREKVLQLEIATRTEFENLNRTKDEFLATVSHELRTPLNAILGWATLLNAGELDSEMQQKAIETIERNAQIQLKLTENLLDVSQIMSGKQYFKSEAVNPTEMLNAAIDSIELAAKAKQIKIEKRFDKGDFLIAGDPNRLQQIFWNLLLNAVKFTQEGGTIEIVLEKNTKNAKISICDNGIGISDEFLSLIFERFRQADGTITRKYGGLGLGLAIVKNLVELHGGAVDAVSEGNGKGSTFVVEIPLMNGKN
jgi:signal transduction histidine kinase/CHASE3 domain sensor protein